MNTHHVSPVVLLIVALAFPNGILDAQREACVPGDSTSRVGTVAGRVVDAESGVPVGSEKPIAVRDRLAEGTRDNYGRGGVRGDVAGRGAGEGAVAVWGTRV